MFKSLIVSAMVLPGLFSNLYGQERKNTSTPAFLMPATVVRATTSPAHPSGNPEADTGEVKATYTQSLEYNDPVSGTHRELQTTKTIRMVDGDKNDSKPIRSAGRKKSDPK